MVEQPANNSPVDFSVGKAPAQDLNPDNIVGQLRGPLRVARRLRGIKDDVVTARAVKAEMKKEREAMKKDVEEELTGRKPVVKVPLPGRLRLEITGEKKKEGNISPLLRQAQEQHGVRTEPELERSDDVFERQERQEQGSPSEIPADQGDLLSKALELQKQGKIRPDLDLWGVGAGSLGELVSKFSHTEQPSDKPRERDADLNAVRQELVETLESKARSELIQTLEARARKLEEANTGGEAVGGAHGENTDEGDADLNTARQELIATLENKTRSDLIATLEVKASMSGPSGSDDSTSGTRAEGTSPAVIKDDTQDSTGLTAEGKGVVSDDQTQEGQNVLRKAQELLRDIEAGLEAFNQPDQKDKLDQYFLLLKEIEVSEDADIGGRLDRILANPIGKAALANYIVHTGINIVAFLPERFPLGRVIVPVARALLETREFSALIHGGKVPIDMASESTVAVLVGGTQDQEVLKALFSNVEPQQLVQMFSDRATPLFINVFNSVAEKFGFHSVPVDVSPSSSIPTGTVVPDGKPGKYGKYDWWDLPEPITSSTLAPPTAPTQQDLLKDKIIPPTHPVTPSTAAPAPSTSVSSTESSTPATAVQRSMPSSLETPDEIYSQWSAAINKREELKAKGENASHEDLLELSRINDQIDHLETQFSAATAPKTSPQTPGPSTRTSSPAEPATPTKKETAIDTRNPMYQSIDAEPVDSTSGRFQERWERDAVQNNFGILLEEVSVQARAAGESFPPIEGLAIAFEKGKMLLTATLQHEGKNVPLRIILVNIKVPPGVKVEDIQFYYNERNVLKRVGLDRFIKGVYGKQLSHVSDAPVRIIDVANENLDRRSVTGFHIDNDAFVVEGEAISTRQRVKRLTHQMVKASKIVDDTDRHRKINQLDSEIQNIADETGAQVLGILYSVVEADNGFSDGMYVFVRDMLMSGVSPRQFLREKYDLFIESQRQKGRAISLNFDEFLTQLNNSLDQKL
ncbi:hypothetical protein A2866_00180 [Candidatus Roizmanbacteria bacterium RIFCSPHIGHO2_01_FULL_39_8]|uniref:Uncharacterized protein n=1 Tax=Candidatus Roizmanbacteria bacterium RIFCSPHIGHO2_01_FULL_39_8 TaxID=1802033 RepID=A0A1F7GRE3_9BACT|nr:MAG: hypothetical protein A2866_00180 [Candidatus Roizmanbacteria bacterium RIFCSPHIGHO2_01_FULL_39_8]